MTIRNKETVTVITPTGDRPTAFFLLQIWMKCQEYLPDQWIIIDDGKLPIGKVNGDCPVKYIRREPRDNDPKHTMKLNLLAALPVITGDRVIIWEDDEYYAPGYIKAMMNALDTSEVVGICHSRYYHIGIHGFYIHGNGSHASLAQTAFRKSFIPTFRDILNTDGDSFVDIRIWKTATDKALFVDDDPLYVGIKGLPGRPGIGAGHRSNYPYRTDKILDVLRKWIPNHHEIYEALMKGDVRPT